MPAAICQMPERNIRLFRVYGKLAASDRKNSVKTYWLGRRFNIEVRLYTKPKLPIGVVDRLKRNFYINEPRLKNAKGRFERRLAATPVKLITSAEPGLLGAAVAFAREFP